MAGLLNGGLMGMGGLGGMSPSMPPGLLKNPMLSQVFDPTAMRNYQIKRGLLGAGVNMLNVDPRGAPDSFGAALGRAAAGGAQSALQAEDDFRQNGMFNLSLMDWQRKEDERAKQQAELNELIKILPPDQQAWARAFPDKFAEAAMRAKFGGSNGPEYGLNPVWAQDEQGNWQLFQPNKQGGDPNPVNFPPGVRPQPQVNFLDTGTGFQPHAVKGGAPVGGTIPKDVAGEQYQKQIGEGAGKAAVDLPRAKGTMDLALQTVDKLRMHPGRSQGTGKDWFRGYIPGTEGYNFRALWQEARGEAFLEGYKVLKGGGQITEVEGVKAEQALFRMDRAQTEEAFLEALNDYEEAIRTGYAKLVETANMANRPASGSGAADPLGIR